MLIKELIRAVSLISIILPISCSVREERRDCPVILSVDMSQCQSDGNNLILSAWNDNVLFRHYYYPDLSDDVMEYSVPKGDVVVWAISDLDRTYIDNMKIICPYGQQYDSVYAYHHKLSLLGEYARDTVVMHKQYAKVSVDVSALEDESDNDFCVTLSAGSCGLEVLTGFPVTGPYCALMERSGGSCYSAIVPRQNDYSMTLDITTSKGVNLTYPLGEMLAVLGYDWGAEDLADIVIVLKSPEAGISISIMDWDSGCNVYVEI